MSIMGDHDQRTRVLDECDAQGLAHFVVEMIGLLIEQQDVGSTHERTGKIEPFEQPERYPKIDLEEVRLICWLAIQSDSEH